MFKSFVIFTSQSQLPSNPENCQLAAESESAPIEISELESIAWASPYGYGNKSLVVAGNGMILMAIEKSQKLIPGAVVTQNVNEKLSELRNLEQREPSKREKASIKEKILCEMSVKAFVKKQIIHICLDPTNQRLIIANTQKATIDACLDLIYKTFPKISLENLQTQTPIATAMTSWLKQSSPENLCLLHECELRDTENNSSIKFKGIELQHDDVLCHLNSTTIVQKLSLVYDEKIQFGLNADGTISGIKYLEYIKTEKAGIFTESLQAEIDADFIISIDVINNCLNTLISALGGLLIEEEETVVA